MTDSLHVRLAVLALAGLLGACASQPQGQVSPPPVAVPVVGEAERVAELERQLVDRQKQCADDKRRLEAALRENQKKLEDTQRKLDALAGVERSIRRRRSP